MNGKRGKRTESLFDVLRQSGPVLRSCLSNGLGIQHKLLWIVAQATCRSRHNSKGLAATDPSSVKGSERDQGIGRTSCPVVLNRFGGEATPASEEEVDVLAALAGLDDSDDDDSSSTISSPFWRLLTAT
ncbi:hypothetical protein GWK47_035045 [Chionoecetes opilio]|uniref:Uncharacterized protein n=1 Tax=Chionoecetes opilio TaxID=41210 RepID=A0A8J5CZN4_CHIOP|nr:hypothetical protein GWK47_035045 [Chionoecetes opilio]